MNSQSILTDTLDYRAYRETAIVCKRQFTFYVGIELH